MRWLIVSARYRPDHGGIGTYVHHAVRAAVQAGWDVHLLCRDRGPAPTGARVHTIRTPDEVESFTRRIDPLRHIERVRPYRYGLWSLAVARALLEMPLSFDAVEFVDCQAEGYVALNSSRVRARWRGVPMLVGAHMTMSVQEMLHGNDSSRFGRSSYHRWEDDALVAADAVFSPSRRHLKYVPAHPCRAVIPLPVPMEDVRPAGDRSSIVLIGSAVPRKGILPWAESLVRVLREFPEMTAAVLGPDTPTGPGGSSLIESARALLPADLQGRFEARGSITHAEVRAAIECAAVIVVPSMHESFSYAAAEALSRGCPVILSDEVGMAEYLPGCRTVPVNDVAALAHAQIASLADQSEARRHALHLREVLQSSCDPKRHIEAKSQLAHEAAGMPSSPGPEPEAMAEMEAFLSDVEAQERALSVRPEHSAR